MRFGTFYFFQAPPGHRHHDIIRRELEQIEWTEELGFDEIWLTEHHFIDYGLSVDPAALAAAAAARTRRIRIGLAAAILPFHHPLRLAEQMALVDIISNGRLDVGVGRVRSMRVWRCPLHRRRTVAFGLELSLSPVSSIHRTPHGGHWIVGQRGPFHERRHLEVVLA